MNYISTRNASRVYSASEAIVKGISDDGGLIVPSSFPAIDKEFIEKFAELDYPERVATVLHEYIEEFSYDELLSYANKAYARFDGDPCPVTKIEDGLFVLELWHGPTFAFKDMALTLLPYLMTASKRKLGRTDKTLILVATSGDTGKAALEGFKDVDGTEIIVFFPSQGVSKMQKLQMLTQDGKNVHVVAIKGNFDDAQTAVKEIFNDAETISRLDKIGVTMSSANSINWGRLVPQIVYYISAYADLVASGEIENGDKVNFCVPTGNFGNILAGYYAYRMGLPVGKLIVASNENNVLTDFFSSGVYDLDRKFYKTSSPSMDIIISSNLERFIFELTGRDDKKVNELYSSLKKDGKFEIDYSLIEKSIFEAGWADEEDTKCAIRNFFDLDDCILDTHTAVAASVYTDYQGETEDETAAVIVSTASPYKFATDVYNAIADAKEMDVDKAIDKLQFASGLECPQGLLTLKTKKVLHDKVIEKEDAKQTVLEIMNA